jgi:hypothetical protein
MKPETSKSKQLANIAAIFSATFALPFIANADTSFTINNTVADAFLASGSPNNPVGTNLSSLNFGAAGTLAIAPASSTKGEFDSVIQFNSTAAVSQFNATYGAGNWQITGLKLMLASNFGTQGSQPPNQIFNTINAGSFGITWISDNNWVEGNGSGMGEPGYPGNSEVSFNSIPTLLSGTTDSLGTYLYTPPGNNVYLTYNLPLNADLVNDAAAGGGVSLYFFAVDNVIYLFNSKSFSSNHPELTLIATATPEPGTLSLLAVSLGGFLAARWRKNKI